ncbi:PAS domain-containing sensor histidine kinase [Natronocalculus amylovorans]|uniref:histidine kinase n=1 Tax=Natronocalculus amylovorans TaxID=2917812 RepID=A0AAE3K8H5_9EURY|nr:PAS domain-containing sensor histidine kinase [Natronocalculus amylovorans]MCL9816505.1 PAS domain-containing sensor histidine kinase [Natronocalculus amylovorans]NUE00951.1 PAS domain-containing sensor histidine kinase [Halorubraceae archaeon YAN]
MKQRSTTKSSEPMQWNRFEQLMTHLQDAVVEFEIVSQVPIIRSVNPAFEETFACDADAVIGTPLNDHIVPDDLSHEATAFDTRTADGKANYAIVYRRAKHEVRRFLYRSVPYANGNRGIAIYSDITDEIRRDRQLAVLHRIIRHNLRNDLNVILGYAETIARRTDDREILNQAQTITETARDLTELSDKARDFERVLDTDHHPSVVEIQPIVTDVAEMCLDRFPDATLDIDVPADVTVRGGSNLEVALDALVDNALRYSPAGDQWAGIVLSEQQEMVEISVLDNGPGIPAHEQSVITGSQPITPLTHGSGLGLWLVAATIDVYGGEIEFDELSDGGSCVTIVLSKA